MWSEGNLPPPPCPFSPNASDKPFEIAILSKIVERSDEKLWCRHTPRGPRGRRCKLRPGGIYGSYGRDTRRNLRQGSFCWKLKVLVHFLRVKGDRRSDSPPRPLLHPNIPDFFFEKFILSKIVQRSNNKNSHVDSTSQGPGEGVVSYAPGAYIVLIEGILI